jgi:hypothetical protein
MELTETIKSLNSQLVDLYGLDTITGRAIWRIVWSEDQFEKRLMETTDEGLLLVVPQVREVPKYRQWITEKYVLERLVLVPDINSKELPLSKQSYEPIWVFMDKNGNYLPPKIQVCKFVIDSIYEAQGKNIFARYKDPESNPEEAKEIERKRIDDLQVELFGDDTDVSDALTYKEAIVVPNSYHNNKEN